MKLIGLWVLLSCLTGMVLAVEVLESPDVDG